MVNMENFKNLTDKINFNDEDDLIKIEKLLFKYPYYQNLYAFYLKSLKNQKKYNYSHILKKTSILTLDRENLYNWLNKGINSKESNIIEDDNDIKSSKKTFIDWIIDNEKKDEISKQERIDKFISNNPKIKNTVSSSKNFITENNFDKFEFMTETLAKMYLKQKKYDEAKRAFKILILNYPEKKSLFANEIKKINKFLKNQ
tara:strand:- start:381 stop:983 length:603 start_codon:yes stop_codon:yes gene_type:complete